METKLPTNVSIFLVLLIAIGLHIPIASMGTVVCDPTTDGGTIGSDQIGTIGGFDPAAITNNTSASGGSGVVEYKWIQSTVPVPNNPGNGYWTEVIGETLSTYDPGMIYKTTYLIRLAKSNTCNDWVTESNMITLRVPSGPVSNCVVYGVQDKKSSDYSQIFTVDVFNNNQVRKFGPRFNGWDIEGLEIDRNTGVLYGCSGNDNLHGMDGYFYSFDGVTGFMNIIGSTGYDDVVSLAFNSATDVLYAWVDDYGLITINTATGAGTMVYSSPLDFDGMAWSNDGATLYVATDDQELFTFDPVTGTLTLLTANLPGPVESLEMRPDGNLLFGTHLASTSIYTINPQTLVINSANNIVTPYDDIESIVWPEWCSLSINVDVQVTNVDCYNSQNGTVTITGSGGVAPYTYLWNTGSTLSSDTNVAPGSYYVVVTDANGVSEIDSFNVSQPTAPLGVTLQTSQPTCTGNLTDGNISALVSGGTAPFTYQWSNLANTSFTSGLGSGTYSVTVTDANGCSVVSTSNIPTICCNVMNAGVIYGLQSNCGAFDPAPIGNAVAAAGGVGAVEYLWLKSNVNVPNTVGNPHWTMIPGSNSTTYDPGTLTETTYFVRCARTSTCSFYAGESNVITIEVNPEVNVAIISSTDALCNGGNTGTALANATGGTGAFSYVWSNGDTTDAISGLAAGIYTVTATDTKGCDATAQVTITEPTLLTGGSSVTANVLINGGSNGSATASANGGTSPYSYVWSTGDTGAVVNGLVAGTYSVTITDANGCSTTSTSVVTEPTTLTSTAVVTSNVDCNGNANGSATASANGAVSPYSFAWSTGATTASVSGLAAGTYSVVITDANGASNTKSVTVTEPTSLTGGSSVTANVLINGGSNGSATASANGGTSPYSFAWSTGDTGAVVNGLVAGTYSVTITDANGCSTTSTSVVTEPTTLTSTAVVTSNVDCNGNANGSATASANGAVSPYSYAWSTGATTASVSGLAAGTYSVAITDANGASNTKSVTVTEPNVLSATIQTAQATCSGSLADGDMSTLVNGGTAPFSYAWSNGATTSTVNGLVPGSYSVTITDANGCITSVTGSIATMCCNVTASGTIIGAQSNCGSFDPAPITSASLPTGGVGTVEYIWLQSLVNVPNTVGNPHWTMIPGSTSASYDPGTLTQTTYFIRCARTSTCTFYAGESNIIAIEVNPTVNAGITANTNASCNGLADGTATVTATGGTGAFSYVWSNGDTTDAISGLAAGTYSVTATDSKGCDAATQVTITEPTLLTGGSSVTANVLINGGSNGSATASANGGTSPYSYAWSTGATTASVSGLVAGTYSVTITDANGCSTTSTSVITEPTALTSTAAVTSNVDCNGNANGSATASANGAVSPYTYAWSNGAATASVSGLAAGTYSVVITDANGASNTKSVTVTEPTILTGGSSVTANVLINGGSNGSATASANGGTSPYTFSWSTGATTASVNGLVAGTYSVTITDANGCSINASSTITEPTVLTSTALVYVNVNCNGNNSGEAGVSASGAVSPYSYAWSNGATTAAISNLVAGTYSVTVTDANGATSIKSVTVTEPNALLVTVQTTQATCSGSIANGGMNTVVNGGSAPFSYAWSTGVTSNTVSNLTPGAYSVTVTDANGCTAIGNGTIATMCCNVTTAGSITGDQSNCGSFDPAPITSSGLPTGGVGNLEYVWLKSLVNVPNTVGNPHWTMIPNSNSASYDPGTITQTTYYLRCARRSNCSFYAGESNVVTMTVNSGLAATLTQVVTGCSNEMFEAAEGFNVFVKENITVKTNETEGAMALGGDLTLAGNYTLAGHTTGSFQDQGDAQNSALVVGGKVVYSGQSGMNVVNNGFVKICDVTGSNIHDWDNQNNQPQNTRISAGGYNTNPRINLSLHQSESSIENCPIDFTAAFTRLEATANSLAACSNNLNMNSTGPNRVAVSVANNTKNVLNVNWNDIKSLQEFKFNNQPTATSSILINVNNVNGGNITWNVPNFPGIGDQHGAYIIWNFINTPKITMTGGGTLKGTLLAPLTDVVDNNSGNIDGQLIAKSFFHNGGEMHNYLFAGNIEGCASGNCETPVTGPVTICASGSATIKADGGDTYLWSTGATTAQTTLGVGNHSVTVTNAQGCSSVENVTINSYAASVVSFITSDVTCNGANDGAADVTVTSGTGPFTYAWSTGGNGSSISGVAAGTYSVTITTGNGCEEVHQVTIAEPSQITATANVVDNSCNSGNTVCDLNLSGYENGEVVSGALPGLGITITSTANRGSLHDLIIFNTNLSGTRDSDLEVDRGNVLIFPENDVDNNNDGVYDLPDDTPYGGTVTLVFDKTRKVKSFDFIDKDSGQNGYAKAYDINNNLLTSQPIVNAGDGSIQTISINKTGVKKLVIYYYNSGGIGNFQFDCSENPLCDGEINLAVSGGAAPYSYQWSNGATTQNLTEVCADQYAVTITDANGCSIVETVDVYEPAKLLGQITGYNATGRNRCDGYINVDFMQGGTPAYNFAWSNGKTSEDISGLCKGTYVVTVTDQNGCMAKGGITLNTNGGVCGRGQYGNDNEGTGITTGSGVNVNETSKISKTIYPNPATENFTIEFSTREAGNLDVVLYDLAGNMVEVIFSGYIAEDDIQSVGHTVEGSLAPGVYTVAFKTDNATTFEKLVIQ